MKLFLLIVLFTSQLCALDVSKDVVPIYKEIEMAHHINTFKEAIEHPNKFILVKSFRRLLHQRTFDNNLWLKINIENPTEMSIERLLITRWERIVLDLYWVKGTKLINFETINNDNYLKNSSIMTLPAKSKLTLYVHLKNKKALDQFSYLYFIDSSELKRFIILRERLYHHSLFFGILLTMAMYSFFMYFSIKEKGYLYLGFYQAWVLIVTSELWQYFFVWLENFPWLAAIFLKKLIVYSLIFFTIIFTKEFLNTKNDMPFFDKLLNISLIVFIPLALIYSTINYLSFMTIIYVLAGLYSYIRGNFAALFYTLGFLGFSVYGILHNLSRIFDWGFYFEFLYAKQIFTCVESFALTMALYLKIKSIVQERELAYLEIRKQEKMMLEQSRFATMGEMLASIAHQWRQPLNHLSMILNNLRLARRLNKLDDQYFNEAVTEGDQQITYMSSTVEDFSNFFSTKGKEEKFKLNEVCEYAIELVSSRLKKQNISIHINSTDNCDHVNYKNELIQVLTTILNNAIDALMSNNIENRKIEILIACDKISILDNAGGILEEALPKIFDPYFSTKNQKFGTGLGLYTVKILVDTLIKGKISAINYDHGACFIISLPQMKGDNNHVKTT